MKLISARLINFQTPIYNDELFNVNMKLLAEMPKIAKCLKCLKLRSAFGGSILINKDARSGIISLISGFSYAKHRSFIIKTERSDSTILGILVRLRRISSLLSAALFGGLGIFRFIRVRILDI